MSMIHGHNKLFHINKRQKLININQILQISWRNKIQLELNEFVICVAQRSPYLTAVVDTTDGVFTVKFRFSEI